MRTKLKRVLALLLTVVILCGLLPVSAAAQESTKLTVYVTMSKYGQIVKDKTNALCAEIPVTLTGKTDYTIDDAR